MIRLVPLSIVHLPQLEQQTPLAPLISPEQLTQLEQQTQRELLEQHIPLGPQEQLTQREPQEQLIPLEQLGQLIPLGLQEQQILKLVDPIRILQMVKYLLSIKIDHFQREISPRRSLST